MDNINIESNYDVSPSRSVEFKYGSDGVYEPTIKKRKLNKNKKPKEKIVKEKKMYSWDDQTTYYLMCVAGELRYYQSNHNAKMYEHISETLKTYPKYKVDQKPHAQQVRSQFSYNGCNISFYFKF